MKINTIGFALLSCSLMVSNAMAGQADDATQMYQPIVGEEKIKLARSNKSRSDSLYYVQLDESPLATYSGELKGFAATSLKSTNRANAKAGGVLNTKSAASKNYLNYLEGKQSQFLNRAETMLKRPIDVNQKYKIVANGFAMELSATEAQMLEKDPSVKSVQKIGIHYTHSDSGPGFIKAKQVWDGVGSYAGTRGEGVIVGILDTGINANHPSFADVDAEGYDHSNPRGAGDYVGDCVAYPKFCNDKLIGIVSYPDIVDSRPAPASEDYDDLQDKLKVGYDFQSHGSHVASTAAGNVLHNVDYYLNVVDDIGNISEQSSFEFESISGVAPRANIISYQVCDYDSRCFPELAVRAVEDAIEHGVNVINYSAGGGSSDPWYDLDSVGFLNARAAGIHVATSAGNAGSDAKTIGSPGNAPWITTVAAYTHDRSFSDQVLGSFSGGDAPLANDVIGKGATGTYTGSVVYAANYGDAACMTPFEEGTFDGQIVLCERGGIARVRKGLNVKEGGAGGLILANVVGGGESLNADPHVLPAVHVNATDGQTLIDWLSAGSDHQATISGSTLISDPELGDVAGTFSSRGPNDPFATLMSPDIAAPGVEIYAANSEDHVFIEGAVETPYTMMSGTSMSSPHVAGALALIYATHPTWTPAQIQSAVMTTAQTLTYTDDDFDGVKERSDLFDQGAGSIRVDRALKAGLLLDITEQDYLDANPANGGVPSSLNMSSMGAVDCVSSCSWTRTVTATAAGTWTAEFETLNPGFDLSVSPASFTLAAGASQELTFTTNSAEGLVDEWVHGFATLKSSNNEVVDTTFQFVVNFAAGIAPEKVTASINTVENTMSIDNIVTIGSTELQVAGFGLSKVRTFEGQAEGAGTNKDPYANLDSVYAVQIQVPAYTKRLIAEITSSTAPDMDLWVGIDEDGNGQPGYWEVTYSTVCLSGNFDSTEKCDIENPPAGNYWIFAHNFEGTAEGALDDVTIEVSQVNYTTTPSFDVDAPETVAQDESFSVNLTINGFLDQQSLEPIVAGEKYYGVVEMGSSAALRRNIGQTLLEINATEAPELDPLVALINGVESYSVTVEEGDADVTLSAQESVPSLPDDELIYSWVQTGGETVSTTTLENGDLQVSIPADVSATTQLTFEVTVADGRMESTATASITVTDIPDVIPPPPPPVEKSGGGSTGFIFSLIGLIAILARRKVK